jgi:hypothetical protein
MQTTATPLHAHEEAAEAEALGAAVAQAVANPKRVPHEDVRAWLLRLAAGEFDAPPPLPR